MFFSKSTGAFYNREYHGENIPDDAVEISQEEYETLIAGQSGQKRIAADEFGRPALVDRHFTPEEIRAQKESIAQAYMDETAREYGYKGIADAITYADEPVVPKFQAEGQAFRAWRSLVWAKCYEILNDVNDGKRPIPSDEELIAELPELDL